VLDIQSYTNLKSNILMWETFNRIHFLPNVRDKISSVEQVRAYEEGKVFGEGDSENYSFQVAVICYTLKDSRHCNQNTHQEITDLRNFYIEK